MSSPIRSADDAAAYLDGLIDRERRRDWSYRRLSLDPVHRLLARLDRPERGLSVLHVAGSKGKGSTALLAESLLLALGERVGTFTSPHLERWTERFRIDGREVPGPDLARAVERLRPHVDALRAEAPSVSPSFFDATTAAAVLLFREAGVDRVILEVGLGGRLDSTNAARAAVACVTNVEFEHADKLGGTLAAIAAEKAGILEPGAPAVVGRLAPEAREVVEARARALGAPLAALGRDVHVEASREADGLRIRVREAPFACEAHLPLLGAHQAANAALAIACVRRLGFGDEAVAAAAATGLAGAEIPGRVELLGRSPWIVVDSAHTPVSAAALAEAIAPLRRRRLHLVLSVSAGKDTAGILAALLPLASEVTVTRAEATRSLSAREVADAVRAASSSMPLRVVPNPQLALRAAREGLGPDDALCVTGSVYLAGIARGVLRAPVEASRVAVTRRSPVSEERVGD